jgi:hypothetical protein
MRAGADGDPLMVGMTPWKVLSIIVILALKGISSGASRRSTLSKYI